MYAWVILYQFYRQKVNEFITNLLFYLFVIPGHLIIDLDICYKIKFRCESNKNKRNCTV